MQHPFDNLSREELLAIAKQQQTELEALRTQSAATTPDMAEAGSIADAAMELSGVFQASQQAADIYLQGVEALKARQEAEYALHLSQTQQMLQEAEAQSRATVARAKESAAFYWAEMHRRLDALFAGNPELVQQLLQLPSQVPSVEDEGFGPDD